MVCPRLVVVPRGRAERRHNCVEVVPVFADQQLECLQPLGKQAKQRMPLESRKHSAASILCSIPGLGRAVAGILAVWVTPHRFRTKRQVWAYAGLEHRTQGSGGQIRKTAKATLVRCLSLDV